MSTLMVWTQLKTGSRKEYQRTCHSIRGTNTYPLMGHPTSQCHQPSPRFPTSQLFHNIKDKKHRKAGKSSTRKKGRDPPQRHRLRLELLKAPTHAIFAVAIEPSGKGFGCTTERSTSLTRVCTAVRSSGVTPTGIGSTLRRCTLRSTSALHNPWLRPCDSYRWVTRTHSLRRYDSETAPPQQRR